VADLKGKTVLVTGGAKGIGRGIALAFAQKGANVVLNYRSGDPSAVVAEIEALGVSCKAVQADVSDFVQAEALAKQAKEAFGAIDCLVNNAGITRDGLLLRMSEADYDAVLDTNLKGTFNMVRHVSPIMLKQRSGAIINVSSVVGLMGNIGQVNYAASKAGVIGLTKSAAKELGSRGITCNAIAPGFIETDMTEAMSEEAKAKMYEMIPLKRFGQAAEVAQLAVFLAEQAYITGQIIAIDGGMTMQ